MNENNNILKQYAAISAKWVNDNPIRAFLPFFYGYIYEKCSGGAIFFEKFKDGISNYWGFKFSYHLIEATLGFLKNAGEATVDEENYWSFTLNEKNKQPIKLGDFDSSCSLLLEKFSAFLKENGKDTTKVNPEKMLISFFANYDNDIILDNNVTKKLKENLKKDEKDYLVACFICEIKDRNPYLFDFILKVVRGSIIKSALFFNKYSLKCMKHQTYFLDTGVVFRMLGFYGEYFEKEYLRIVRNLKSHCKDVCITQYVFAEIKRILDVCENYVECSECDLLRSPEILIYFRKKEMNRENVRDIIVNLEKNIANIGVKIVTVTQVPEKFENYNEDYGVLKESIKPVYSSERYIDGYNEVLETDLNSILYAYCAYGGSAIKEFQYSEVFFVTTNRSLISKVSEYHKKMNKSSVIPLIDDRFLGLLLPSGNLEGQEVEKLSLLAFCEKCQKPSDDMIKKYREQIEILRKRNQLTDDDVFKLKNYDLFDDALMKGYVKNGYVANNDCVFNVLDEIHAKMIGTERKRHEEELEQVKKIHCEELNIKNNEMLKQREKIENKKKELKEQKYSKHDKLVRRVYIIVSLLLILFCLFLVVLSILYFINSVKDEEKTCPAIVFMALTIAGLISTGYLFVSPLIRKGGKIQKLISKFIDHLNKKSDNKIDEEFNFDK